MCPVTYYLGLQATVDAHVQFAFLRDSVNNSVGSSNRVGIPLAFASRMDFWGFLFLFFLFLFLLSFGVLGCFGGGFERGFWGKGLGRVFFFFERSSEIFAWEFMASI